MYPDAEKRLQDILKSDPVKLQEWEQNHKLKNDPRIHPGRNFLPLAFADTGCGRRGDASFGSSHAQAWAQAAIYGAAHSGRFHRVYFPSYGANARVPAVAGCYSAIDSVHRQLLWRANFSSKCGAGGKGRRRQDSR